jgi:hypothetical protein
MRSQLLTLPESSWRARGAWRPFIDMTPSDGSLCAGSERSADWRQGMREPFHALQQCRGLVHIVFAVPMNRPNIGPTRTPNQADHWAGQPTLGRRASR